MQGGNGFGGPPEGPCRCVDATAADAIGVTVRRVDRISQNTFLSNDVCFSPRFEYWGRFVSEALPGIPLEECQ